MTQDIHYTGLNFYFTCPVPNAIVFDFSVRSTRVCTYYDYGMTWKVSHAVKMLCYAMLCVKLNTEKLF